MNDKTSLISSYCRELFNSSFFTDKNNKNLLNKDFPPELLIFKIFEELDNINEKFHQTKIFNIDIQTSTIISVIYNSLGSLLTTPVYVLSLDKSNQSYLEIQIIDYLIDIEKYDFHKLTTTNNGCPFHTEDLFTHLHLTCFTTLFFLLKLKPDITTFELMKHAVISLLHDIGKPSCLKIVPENNYVSFPFHGELGAGMLLQLWASNFPEPFTKNVWEEICRTICIHMCGYKSIDFEKKDISDKMMVLSYETQTVKDNLLHLSYGDYFGSIKKDSFNCVSPQTFIESRNKFKKIINDPVDFEKIIEKHIFSSTVLFIRGQKFFGKSTFVNKIIKFLNTKQIEYSYYDKLIPTDKTRIDLDIRQNKFIIIELSSEVSFSPSAIDICLPNSMKNTFKISINLIRNLPFDQTFNEKEYFKCNKNLYNWISSDSHDLYNLSSFSSSFHNSKSKPSTSFLITYNHTTELGDFELFRQLNYFLKDTNRSNSPLTLELFLNTNEDLNNTKSIQPHTKITNETINETINETTDDKNSLDLSNTDNMDILEYCNMLYRTTSWEAMIEIIKSQHFIVSCPSSFKSTPYANRVIRIKYLEHNKLWKAKWARQCRGIILFLNDDNIIIPIKYHLQRGAEVLTQNHIKSGISDTNDMTHDDKINNIFDNDQCNVMKKLSSGGNINGVLSFKSDGSLFGLSYYFGECVKLVDDFIESSDDFSKSIYSLGLNSGNRCVGSSQTTFSMGHDMQPYNVTAILGEVYGDEKIKEIIQENISYSEALTKYGSQWINKTNNICNYIHNLYPDAITITLNFESICKNRTSAWELSPHNELATTYEKSCTKFLGVSICGKKYVKFIPHFDIEKNVKMCITEPYYWRIKTTEKVNTMLQDLESTIVSNITPEEFLTKHPPNNILMNSENTRFFTINDMDFEGFIFYTETPDTILTGEYNYNKIKSTAYYKSHIFRYSNIKYLIELSDTAGHIFPLSKKVKNFFDNFSNNLSIILKEINDEIQKPPEINKFYKTLPQKAQQSFLTKSIEIKSKMIINGSNQFPEISFDIFSNYFKDLLIHKNTNEKYENVCRSIKSIIMSFEPWKYQNLEEYENVSKMYLDQIEKYIGLQELLGHCIDS